MDPFRRKGGTSVCGGEGEGDRWALAGQERCGFAEEAGGKAGAPSSRCGNDSQVRNFLSFLDCVADITSVYVEL